MSRPLIIGHQVLLSTDLSKSICRTTLRPDPKKEAQAPRGLTNTILKLGTNQWKGFFPTQPPYQPLMNSDWSSQSSMVSNPNKDPVLSSPEAVLPWSVPSTRMLTVGSQLWLLAASQSAAHCACVSHSALCEWWCNVSQEAASWTGWLQLTCQNQIPPKKCWNVVEEGVRRRKVELALSGNVPLYW